MRDSDFKKTKGRSVPTALTEDRVLVPSTHTRKPTPACHTAPGELTPSLASAGPCTPAYTFACTLMHKNKPPNVYLTLNPTRFPLGQFLLGVTSMPSATVLTSMCW